MNLGMGVTAGLASPNLKCVRIKREAVCAASERQRRVKRSKEEDGVSSPTAVALRPRELRVASQRAAALCWLACPSVL